MLTPRSQRRRALEAGQILPMTLMLLALLIGFAAIVTDVGFFLQRREKVQHITDAAALAGAQELPDDPAAAEARAIEWADRNGYNGPPLAIDFECRRGCDPGQYDTITVSGSMKSPVTLMPVLRLVGGGDTCWTTDGCDVTGMAAAEARTGAQPVDIALILDRTGSMTECRDREDNDRDGRVDEDDPQCQRPDHWHYREDGSPSALAKAKEGARTMLEALDPLLHHVALAVLPPSEGMETRFGSPPSICRVGGGSQSGSWPDNWLVAGLSDDYLLSNGSLDTSSRLVGVLDCLRGGGATNLAYPLRAAREHLQTAGRPGVKQVIVLLTDGAANRPSQPSSGTNPCALANSEATIAKNAGIEIYAIGYGISDRCTEDDPGTFWRNRRGDELVLALATDADHAFIEPANSDLRDEFEEIAASIAAGYRLVD